MSQKILLNRITKFIAGLFALITLLVALSPEGRSYVLGKIYQRTGVDKPLLMIENFDIYTKDKPFSGCDPGYYRATNSYDLNLTTNQSYIYFLPLHDMRLTLRELSYFTDSPIAVKKIYLEVLEFYPNYIQEFFASGDCGAGAIENIYYAKRSNINKSLTSTNPVKFELQRLDTVNDFVVLNETAQEDYYRFLIPLDEEGIYKLKIIFEFQYKGITDEISTEAFYLGSSEQSTEYWNKEAKPWYEEFSGIDLEIFDK